MGRTTKSAVKTKDRSSSNNPKLTFLPTADLVPDPRNPRTRDRAQIGAITGKHFFWSARITLRGSMRRRAMLQSKWTVFAAPSENCRWSYGFRLIDSTMKGDSRVLAKQIVWSAMSRGILTHRDSL